MTQSRAVQIDVPGGEFTLIHRVIPSAGAGQVVVQVQACGVCHSDSLAKEGKLPLSSYPLVPGHEIAGFIYEVGEGVQRWMVGQRVGIGCFGGSCGQCEPCRHGNLTRCANMPIAGMTVDGGYADHVVVSAQALAAIPDELTAVDAAPLMCAGVTTLNGLRHSGATPGDTVAVLGMGGLGHLAVQYAARSGYRVVAIARGKNKEAFARDLGANEYIDSTLKDPAEALLQLGGAAAILSTVTSAKAVSAVIGGLSIGGRLMVLGSLSEPIEVTSTALIRRGISLQGETTSTVSELEDTLAFSARFGVRAVTETAPLEKVSEAYEKMMAGDARFRMVLTMDE